MLSDWGPWVYHCSHYYHWYCSVAIFFLDKSFSWSQGANFLCSKIIWFVSLDSLIEWIQGDRYIHVVNICPVSPENCINWKTNDTLKEFPWKSLEEKRSHRIMGRVKEKLWDAWEVWRAAVHGFAKSWTQLNDWTDGMLKHQEFITVGSPSVSKPEGIGGRNGVTRTGENLEPCSRCYRQDL